jgi:hypothetical protein
MTCNSFAWGLHAARKWSLVGLVALTLAAAAAESLAADSRVIYMVIQTHPSTTVGEVRQKFDDARKATPGCSVKDVLIEPVDPGTYATLRSIVTRGTAPLSTGRTGADTATIEPLKGSDGSWCINLQKAFSYIDSVEVELAPDPQAKAGGNAARTVTLALDVPNPEGYRLQFHSPGCYVLTLPKGRFPRAIKCQVTDEAEGENAKPISRELAQAWPDVGRSYLVTLSDVKGNEALLFDALQDASKVGNPIKEIQDATKATLMVASFLEVTPMLVELVDGRVVFNFPIPQGVNPKRLWVMFPLTPGQMQREKEALDAVLAEDDGFKKLPELVRKNIARGPLSPGTGSWVEVPRKGAYFSGAWPIDVSKWQDQLARNAAEVGDNALLMYEFESPSGGVVPIKMETGYVVDRSLSGWVAGLRAAQTR